MSDIQRSIRMFQNLARMLYALGVLLILFYLIALSSDVAKPDFFLTAVILILAGMNINTVSALKLRVHLLEKELTRRESAKAEHKKEAA